MPVNTYYDNGSLHEVFDDAALIYTELDPEGYIIEQRPYTSQEAAAILEIHYNREFLKAQARNEIPNLLATVADLKLLADIPNKDLTNAELKKTIRHVRTVSRTLIRVTRLLADAVETVDAGTD